MKFNRYLRCPKKKKTHTTLRREAISGLPHSPVRLNSPENLILPVTTTGTER